MTASSDPAVSSEARRPRVSSLRIFVFLWAAQALVHQAFFQDWLEDGNLLGWLLTGLALYSFLRPESMTGFSLMLACSIAFNVGEWPYVVNHILVESVVNTVLLVALWWSFARDSRAGRVDPYEREENAFATFAPVLVGMLVIVYYCAFVAKLNSDFLDVEVSCVTKMYGDLLRRLPLLPTARWAKLTAIWATIAIEGAIPLLLTFRRTRLLAVAIGLPFHLMLGAIGHWTFSALVYSLYSVLLMGRLAPSCESWLGEAERRFGPDRLLRIRRVATAAVAGGVLSLIALDLAGLSRAGIGPLKIYRLPIILWGLWSLCLIGVYATAVVGTRRTEASDDLSPSRRRPPRWLYAAVVIVAVNGLSQYLGLKTQTSFTMYSNLRTEGAWNNHLFMPALRMTGYQDDLIEPLRSDHPHFQEMIDEDLMATAFEVRRFLGRNDDDLTLEYRRAGEVKTFERRNGVSSDSDLARPPGLLAAKLLYFRGISKGPRMGCHH